MENSEIENDTKITKSIIAKNSKILQHNENEKIFLLGENTIIKL